MNGWSMQREALLADWRRKCQLKGFVHDISSRRYAAWSSFIEIPMVVASGVTTSALLSGAGAESDVVRYVIGGVSMLATILGSVNSLMKFGKLRDAHCNASREYEDLGVDMADVLSRPLAEREVASSCVRSFRMRLQQLNQTSPSVPNSVLDMYARNVTTQVRELTSISVDHAGMLPARESNTPRGVISPNSNRRQAVIMGLSRSMKASDGSGDDNDVGDMGLGTIENALDITE